MTRLLSLKTIVCIHLVNDINVNVILSPNDFKARQAIGMPKIANMRQNACPAVVFGVMLPYPGKIK